MYNEYIQLPLQKNVCSFLRTCVSMTVVYVCPADRDSAENEQ